ncbi:hypothetical protein D3C71_2092170 [compost metagenome]
MRNVVANLLQPLIGRHTELLELITAGVVFDFLTPQIATVCLGADHVAWLFVYQLRHTHADRHGTGIGLTLGDEHAPLLL